MAASRRMSEPDRADRRYLIALGSNIRHTRHGSPRKVVAAALVALEASGIRVDKVSRIHDTAPMGPSRRTYANAAAIVAASLDPAELLAVLQSIEAEFGRLRRGRAWRERVLDLDVILWSGGTWVSPGLVVPHLSFRERSFVLGPAAQIAGDWRDPITMRQLNARLNRERAVPVGSVRRS